MAEKCFHPSIEGAQHGAKKLSEFLDYAKKSGAQGAQPSNYMLNTDKGLMSAADIKSAFAKAKLSLDGVSSILITSNDLAGAWAMRPDGQAMLPLVSAEARQREFAFRAGVNIVMYTLTGNYKADQVHVPALLERLGQ